MTWDVVVRVGHDLYEPPGRGGVPRLVTAFEQFTDPNFVRNNSLDLIRAKTGREPPSVVVDLIHMAMAVYSADLRVNRKHGKDRWSRTFLLHLPVAEPERWAASEPLLSRMLRYLTGDAWEVQFRDRVPLTVPPPGQQQLTPPRVVSLFSGGLDSLVGAIDLLHDGATVALVGHHGAGITNGVQQAVLQSLSGRYATAITPFLFHAQPPKLRAKDGETSMRSRSILFLSLGIAVAATLGPGTPLYVAENGLISLNVPLTPSRSGSSSTRTTHPHFLNLLRELLTALEVDVPIETPYRFKTKGEMLRECRDQATLARASASSMSCSHPESGRFRGRSPSQHCGYCVPCIIRRASLHAAGLPQNQYSIDVLTHPPGADTDTGRDGGTRALCRRCRWPGGDERWTERGWEWRALPEPSRGVGQTGGGCHPVGRDRVQRLEPSFALLPLQEALHGGDGVDVTGRGPLAELGHVHAAVPGLAVVDPALGLLETLAECSLGQGCLFPDGAEELWDAAVGWRVLGLGGHLTEFPCQSP